MSKARRGRKEKEGKDPGRRRWRRKEELLLPRLYSWREREQRRLQGPRNSLGYTAGESGHMEEVCDAILDVQPSQVLR